LAVVVLTIIAFLVLGGFEAWHDSATFDEPVYVSSGVAAILHHDLADNAEHPPLFKVLAALPVLAVGPVVPVDGHWNVNNERTYSARFVEAQMRAGTMHRVTFASRLVPLLECALLALALYGLAALLFGMRSGVVAALLWLLNPLVLGLGHLDGVDLPFALTTVLVSWALVRWLRRRDGTSLVWLGAACGAAVSAQTTGILVAAVAAGVVVAAVIRSGQRGWRLWRQPLVVALVAWALVWAVYIALDPAIVLHSWVILPQPYVEGLKFLATNDTKSSPGFLLGVSWTGASVWFWFATLLVKLSTPILVLLVAGPLVLVALVRAGRISRSTWRQTLVAVILPGVVLFVFELPTPRTLGVRYLLPSIALWIVAASPIALVVTRRLGGHGGRSGARRGRRHHRVLISELDRLYGCAVPARLSGGHRLQRGLGPGFHPPDHLEPGSASLYGVLRPTRRHRRRYRRVPPARRCRAVPYFGLGGGVGK
jgi:hypothetical protein